MNLEKNDTVVQKKASNNDNGKKNVETKTKKGFKMPSSLVIIISVLFGFIVFTWILDWMNATYTVEGAIPSLDYEVGVTSFGLLGFGNAMAEGFGDAYSLIFYLFILGALIEVLLVTGTLEAGVGSLIKGLNGKELALVPLLFVLFSAGGTVYGMQEETIGLIVIIVPALVIAGFDTITGLLVVILGSTTGFAMSIVNPFAVAAGEQAIDGSLGTDLYSVVGEGILFRMFWWVVLTSIGSAFVTIYADRVKKDEKNSFNSSKKIEEDKKWVAENFKSLDEIQTMTGRQKVAITLFMSSFGIMILGMIPWPSLIGYDGVTSQGWPAWIAWLMNGTWQPGEWYFGELCTLFALVTIIIIFVLKMPLAEASKTCWNGAKAMFSVAILIGVARGIPYVLNETGAQTWLVQSMTNGLDGMSKVGFLYMMVPILFVLSLIIPSTSGLAGAALPIITGSAIATTGGEVGADTISLLAGVLVVFLLMCGTANMFVPTQSVVMAQMDASHVNYSTALKPIGIYVGIMFLVTITLIVPSTLIL